MSNIIEEKAEVSKTSKNEKNETRTGVVTNCSRLRVREKGNIDANVICEIENGAELIVYKRGGNRDFYKVCTAFGVEGFCMKAYVEVE